MQVKSEDVEVVHQKTADELVAVQHNLRLLSSYFLLEMLL